MPDKILVVIAAVPFLLLLCRYFVLPRPRLFFAGYLIVSTKLFGFLPQALGALTLSMMFFLNLVVLLGVALRRGKGKLFSNKKISLFLAGIGGLIAFGIVYPRWLGYSGITSAVIDGKDMFSYAVLAYLAINYRQFDFNYFLKLFCSVACVLVVLLILGKITHFCPPSYYRKEFEDTIAVCHSTYIAFAACLLAPRLLERTTPANLALFIFLGVGLVLQGHRALLLTTSLALFLFFFLRAPRRLKLASALIGLPLLLAFPLFGNGELFERLIADPIAELRGEGAIEARERINVLRYEYIRERPLLGYGFIDESSSLGSEIELEARSRFEQTLSVVDSGYVDMRVRFGIVGTAVFCLLILFVLSGAPKKQKKLDNEQLAMLLLATAYFLINYTWSVFTYGFGIVCLGPAIHLMYQKRPQEYQRPRPQPKQKTEVAR